MRSAAEILSIKCEGIAGATASLRSLALDESKQFILNYCNISSIPSELNFVWANLAFDLLNGAYISSDTAGCLDCIKPCEVNSVSAGDMSVSRGSDTMAHKVDLDSLLFNYKDQLNRFRRVNWGISRRYGVWC